MSGTIIDRLIVTLGLDPSGFTKGQKEAASSMIKTKEGAEKAGKEISEANKKAAESFRRVKEEVLSVVAVMLGGYGVKEFISHIVESDAAVGRLAKNLNMSTEELSAWENVAKKFGSSSGDMDDAFRNLSSMMEEFRTTGWSKGFEPLVRAGVDLNKFTNSATTNAERMKMISAALGKLPREEAQHWGQMAGLRESTINMLLTTGNRIDDLIAKQKEENAVTDAAAEKAEKLEQAWAGVLSKMEGVARSMWGNMGPAIENVLALLNQFADFAKQHLLAVEIVVGGVGAALTGLSLVKFGGLIAGLLGVEAAAGTVMTVLGPIALGVAAITAAVWGLNKVINNDLNSHKEGEIDPTTGKTWVANANRRGGHWADKGGKPTARWVGGGGRATPGHWVDIATGQPINAGSTSASPSDDLSVKAPGAVTEADRKRALAQYPRGFRDPGDPLGDLDASLKAHPEDSAEIMAERMRYLNSIHAGVARAASVSNSSSSSSKTEVHIGSVTINQQPGQDGKGLARDFVSGVNDYAFAVQSNNGLR